MSALDAITVILEYLSGTGEPATDTRLHTAIVSLASLRDLLVAIYGELI